MFFHDAVIFKALNVNLKHRKKNSRRSRTKKYKVSVLIFDLDTVPVQCTYGNNEKFLGLFFFLAKFKCMNDFLQVKSSHESAAERLKKRISRLEEVRNAINHI